VIELLAKILGDWLITKILAQLPAPLRGFVVFAAIAALILTGIYLAWTTWTVSRVLRKSLGRKLRLGEDVSLNSWMRVPTESLDSATRAFESSLPVPRILEADSPGKQHLRVGG